MLEEFQKGLQGTKNFLNEKAGNFNDMTVEALEKAIAASWYDWLQSHPVIGWLFTHPFYTLVLFFLGLLFLGGLFRAISRLTEQFWINIFQFPFKWGQWLLGRVSLAFSRSPQMIASGTENQQERMASILSRLEAIGKEQEALFEEIKHLTRNA